MPLKKIKELAFDVDLNSCEGLDVNYVSSIRTNYLITQHQTMIKHMQFADAKAGALIALMGFISLRGPIKIGEASQTGFFEHIFFITSGIAVLLCLFSIFPRYPSKNIRNDLFLMERWSWPALAGNEKKSEEYSEYIRTAEVSQLVHSLSMSNCFVATILLSKYQMLRIGFAFGLMSVFLMGLKILGVF
jgi:hypothetical protein